MIDVAPTVSAALRLPAPMQAKGASIREVVADLAGVGRVAVLALDALGMFAWNLWKGEMPYPIWIERQIVARFSRPRGLARSMSFAASGER